MSSLHIRTDIARLLNDHLPLDLGGLEERVGCGCGDDFAYYSRWAMHASEVIVEKILGGSL